ncbi:hypothetical protein GIB67_003883 [Kingdonia uniflora]|uniref:RNase H type-1 domain-containing protein n=1 Tax=Kingdonia uniflora TaxID=39325 RepID=A0A7J7LJW3_9MAGN|nr:hypothetical protein GIB67_003883 [Kingdonia uniflora]
MPTSWTRSQVFSGLPRNKIKTFGGLVAAGATTGKMHVGSKSPLLPHKRKRDERKLCTRLVYEIDFAEVWCFVEGVAEYRLEAMVEKNPASVLKQVELCIHEIVVEERQADVDQYAIHFDQLGINPKTLRNYKTEYEADDDVEGGEFEPVRGLEGEAFKVSGQSVDPELVAFAILHRNNSVFEVIPVRPYDIKCKISAAIKDAAGLSVYSMSNNCLELAIVADLGVPTKARPLPRVQSCTWALPWFQEVKINVGAVAIGSPGTAGIEAVIRNHRGDVIGVLSNGLGITTLFFFECEAAIGVLYWAAQRNWNNIWVKANFQTAITDLGKN